LETLKLRQRCQYVAGDFIVFVCTSIFFCFCFAVCMWTCKPHGGYGMGYEDYEFMDMWRSMVSTLSTLFGIFVFRHAGFSSQQLVLFIVFCILIVFIMARQALGMFVDISLTTYKQMSEFAYMKRASTLIEYNAARSSEERYTEWESFNFAQRIEYDRGDLGISGGLQVDEDINSERMRHDRAIGDRIVRYPGSTGDKVPWPKLTKHKEGAEETCKKISNVLSALQREFKSVLRKLSGTQAGDTSHLGSSGKEGQSGQQGESSST
jgi:hypothetical protein